MSLIAPPDDRVRQPNGKQQTRQRVCHGFIRQIMLALRVTCLVKELEDIAEVSGKRRQAALFADISKDTDLVNAIVKRERVGEICYCERRDRHTRCQHHDDQSEPASAQGYTQAGWI